MKSKVLSVAIAAALFANAALAGTQPADTWQVVGIPSAKLAALQTDVGGFSGSGPDVARSLIAALRAQGYIGAHATVYPATHEIVVSLSPTGRSGDYAAYLPSGTLNTQTLDTSMALAEAAAAANGQQVHISIGQHSVKATGLPSNQPPVFGGIALTSYGSRFSGSDTVSAFANGHYDGSDASATVSAGLPSWTPEQSLGGGYLSEDLDLYRPTPYGIFSLKLGHTTFHAGGKALPLDLRGTIYQASVGDKYPISPNLWLRGGFAYSYDENKLDSLDWTTHQSVTSAYLGVTTRGQIPTIGGTYHIRASIWQGIGGHQWEQGPSIMGQMSPTYTVARARLSLRKRFDVANFPVYTHAIFGVQYGSQGTPQMEQAYIGGQHRGSSFYTGAYAGNSGLWYDLNARTQYYKIPDTDGDLSLAPYATFNGGEVQQTGITTHVASAGAGLDMRITRHVYAQVGYNWALQNQPGTHEGGLIGFSLVGSF